jgi:hypothetical protein
MSPSSRKKSLVASPGYSRAIDSAPLQLVSPVAVVGSCAMATKFLRASPRLPAWISWFAGPQLFVER